MIVVFYDRKNKREVKSSELMRIRLVRNVYVDDGDGTMVSSEIEIASVGYKDKNCGSHTNWDLYCTENDLVFLRLEE